MNHHISITSINDSKILNCIMFALISLFLVLFPLLVCLWAHSDFPFCPDIQELSPQPEARQQQFTYLTDFITVLASFFYLFAYFSV